MHNGFITYAIDVKPFSSISNAIRYNHIRYACDIQNARMN